MLTNGLLGILGNYIPTNNTVDFNRSLYNVLVTQNLNGKKSFNMLRQHAIQVSLSQYSI